MNLQAETQRKDEAEVQARVNCGGRRGSEQGTRTSQRRGTLVQIVGLARLLSRTCHSGSGTYMPILMPQPSRPAFNYTLSEQLLLGPLP